MTNETINTVNVVESPAIESQGFVSKTLGNQRVQGGLITVAAIAGGYGLYKLYKWGKAKASEFGAELTAALKEEAEKAKAASDKDAAAPDVQEAREEDLAKARRDLKATKEKVAKNIHERHTNLKEAMESLQKKMESDNTAN